MISATQHYYSIKQYGYLSCLECTYFAERQVAATQDQGRVAVLIVLVVYPAELAARVRRADRHVLVERGDGHRLVLVVCVRGAAPHPHVDVLVRRQASPQHRASHHLNISLVRRIGG